MAVRLSVEDRQRALEEKMGSEFAPMAGRVMKEYVALSEAVINDKAELQKMVSKSWDFIKTLPQK